MKFNQKKYLKKTAFEFKKDFLIYNYKGSGLNVEKEIYYYDILPGIEKLKEKSYTPLIIGICGSLVLLVVVYGLYLTGETEADSKSFSTDDLNVTIFIGTILVVFPFTLFFYSIRNIWSYMTRTGNHIQILNTPNRIAITDEIENRLKLLRKSYLLIDKTDEEDEEGDASFKHKVTDTIQ